MRNAYYGIYGSIKNMRGGFFEEIENATKFMNTKEAQNLFKNYEEYTSGSTGKPKQCLRTSLSWHIEFLRLRELLDFTTSNFKGRDGRPQHIFYYSKYGKSSFSYTDTSQKDLHIEKYVYDNVEDLFDRLSAFQRPFILSGSPSSLIELLDLGFEKFTPSIVILAGENCPSHAKVRISQISPTVLNAIVAREVGLLGFQCPGGPSYHYFSNCLRIERDALWRLQIEDPSNYLINHPISTGDDISELQEETCHCGFSGVSSRSFQGRKFDKGYPAL